MSTEIKDPKCQSMCWLVAAGAGLLTFFVLMMVAGKSLLAAIILGALVFIFLGFLFNWLFCAPVPQQNERAKTAAPASAQSAAPAPASTQSAAQASSASVAAAAASKPAAEKPAAAPAAAKADAVTKAEPAPAPAAPKAAPAKAEKAKAAPKAAAKAAPKKKKAAPKAAAKADANTDFDGDGKLEGTDEGTKPDLLTAPRAGGADDLKRIKGIGPKLEGVCNSMGVYHFDQIAAWTADEMAWVNANLTGFKGRATRDKWVEQAKLLAAGGETEFSKRVDKGSVY